ncbi:bifunctional 23S rRNA (guanine(2069)-N(7))-methyltransferase RlmK/23S rRNA (guanine(2445)-N(2))-methyltransferase RlmL [bacterium]|nr:bifunctional 23S rRNA (guanine(2069)-N(7))-methyltransferase RlmK/23S rRNA (guanine(2445)-N(2))-methyltransferase RlmL [bacterium]
MNNSISFFATSPKGIEPILESELIELGAESVKQARAGVRFTGNIETAYRACLWLRTANRVLYPLLEFPAATPDELYDNVRQIDWFEHIEPNGTFAVDFQSSQSGIDHSHYGALKVKDAIVDQFRDKFKERPSIDLKKPDIRVNVYLLKDTATVYLDLSGESLHRRGYRTPGVAAPMKENLAAAILLRSGWPEIYKKKGGLIDPMCGSGTLPIEAALIAADSAPGLLRDYFGFFSWKQHKPDVWQKLIDEAEERESVGFGNLVPIVGYDSNAWAIKTAHECIEKAGLRGMIHIEKRELAQCEPHPKMKQLPGLVILNPPYGKRIGDTRELMHLYASLGQKLRTSFKDWNATLFTGNSELGKTMGIRSHKMYTLFNGTIECKLLNFKITPEWFVSQANQTQGFNVAKTGVRKANPEIEMLSNRLKKNLKNLNAWLKRENITCFRAYDKDLPEYAVSIDIYENYIHVQEYKAPDTIDPEKAKTRLFDILSILPDIFEVPIGNIFLKTRQQQKGKLQYQKQMSEQTFYKVQESGNTFLINLSDYLDTGLFLDHRLTRQLVGEMAQGKRFLNLFAYTGSATVYAAKGGAKSTTTIDMSKQYISWARNNIALNGFGYDNHHFEQTECVSWMENEKKRYDLIFLDPPTFSNSKKMKDVFDIQRDHVRLIELAVGLLEKKGQLVFSNNFRKFKMDSDSLKGVIIENITKKTIPRDFDRNPKIHNCWMIQKKV